jgi:uncharacterized surface protein with fasciclin (FAS1) repeats
MQRRGVDAPRQGSVQAKNEEQPNMQSKVINLAAATVAALGVAAGAVRAADKDIVDTAISAGQFKMLAAALSAADLVETLKGTGPFTVFAPTDEAFAALPQDTVANLLKPENKAQLTAILTYHVVPGKVAASDVAKLKEAQTVNGKAVAIAVNGGTVTVNDAKVTSADISASNGIIHVIDKVILPPAG